MRGSVLPYRVDDQLGVIVVTIDLQPSLEDWRATLDAIASDPRWSERMNVITDRRQAPAPDGDYVRNAIRTIADRFAHVRGMRWATVAPPGQVAFGMGRMAELVSESVGVTFRMFQSLEEALAWAAAKR